jgi:hypothetical protein
MTTAEGLLSFIKNMSTDPDAWNVVAKRPAAEINASKPEL